VEGRDGAVAGIASCTTAVARVGLGEVSQEDLTERVTTWAATVVLWRRHDLISTRNAQIIRTGITVTDTVEGRDGAVAGIASCTTAVTRVGLGKVSQEDLTESVTTWATTVAHSFDVTTTTTTTTTKIKTTTKATKATT